MTSAVYTPAGTGVVNRFDYAYDNYGNVTQVKETVAGIATVVFSPALNAKNQVSSTGYAWDTRGNLTARPRGRAADTYTWDGANRLLMAQESGGRYTENFLYDERGLRLKKWAAATTCIPAQDDYTTYYVYGQGGQVLAEYDAGGRCLRDYVYLGGMLVAEWQPAKGRFLYYTNDPVRSVRLVSDPAGKVVWSAAYAPFGRMEKVWAREYNPSLKYSGKERDELLGLEYFGARYYAFGLYRFNSTDPVVDVAAAIENPQRWNRYAYCLNNPVLLFDPNGMDAVTSNRSVQMLMLHLLRQSYDGTRYGEWGCIGRIDRGGQVRHGNIEHSANQSSLTFTKSIVGAQFILHTHPTNTPTGAGKPSPVGPATSGGDADTAKASNLDNYAISTQGVYKVTPGGQTSNEEGPDWVVRAMAVQSQTEHKPETVTVPLPTK